MWILKIRTTKRKVRKEFRTSEIFGVVTSQSNKVSRVVARSYMAWKLTTMTEVCFKK